jgi:hypothetical protein
MARAVIPFGIAFLAALSLTVIGTSLSLQAAEGGDTHLITLTASAAGPTGLQMASHTDAQTLRQRQVEPGGGKLFQGLELRTRRLTLSVDQRSDTKDS